MNSLSYEAAAYMAHILRSVGHPVRVQILQLIAGGRCCVYELCASLGIEQSNMSQHLRAMRQSGVICAKREGNRVYYSVCCLEVMSLLKAVEAIADHCTLEQRDAFEARHETEKR